MCEEWRALRGAIPAGPHMEENVMDELYIDVSTNLLYDIRLRIEGAVDLYEGDALCLKRLAVDNDKLDAACAFDTIGSALYDLRRDIQKLHAAHIRECIREARS